MTLKLYYAPGACSFVPHTLLQMSGAAFEPVNIRLHKGEQRSPDYLALNPNGQVPVLVDGDAVITQIVAIVLHLETRFSALAALPAQGLARSRALSTLAWMNNTVHPAFTHFFMPQKFTDDEAAQQKLRAQAAQQYRALLGQIEALAAQAAPWLAGPSPGALDAYALTLLRWGGYAGIDPTSLPACWSLAHRFAALPAVAQVVERERLQLNVYTPASA